MLPYNPQNKSCYLQTISNYWWLIRDFQASFSFRELPARKQFSYSSQESQSSSFLKPVLVVLPFNIHLSFFVVIFIRVSKNAFLYSTKDYTYSWSGKFIQLQYELPSIPWDFCYIPWDFHSRDWALSVIQFVQSSSSKQATGNCRCNSIWFTTQ